MTWEFELLIAPWVFPTCCYFADSSSCLYSPPIFSWMLYSCVFISVTLNVLCSLYVSDLFKNHPFLCPSVSLYLLLCLWQTLWGVNNRSAMRISKFNSWCEKEFLFCRALPSSPALMMVSNMSTLKQKLTLHFLHDSYLHSVYMAIFVEDRTKRNEKKNYEWPHAGDQN